MKWSYAIPATLALLTLAPPLRASLITNGTFATPSDWVLSGSPICVASISAAFGNPLGSLLLNACGEAASNPAGAQTVNGLIPGATYNISADVRLHVNAGGSGSGKSFGIFVDSQLVSPIFSTEFLNQIWNPITTSFVATGVSHTVIFAAELDRRTPGVAVDTDVSYYVDNISMNTTALAAIPEPGMFWLLSSGLVAIGSRRLLQRRRL